MSNITFLPAFQTTKSIASIPTPESSNPGVAVLASNSRIIWGVITAMSAVAIAAYWTANLSFAWSSGRDILACVLIFLAASCFYRKFRPDHWITLSAESCAQLTLVLSLGCALSYPLAATGFPYRDAALNAADMWMGLDWRGYLHFVNNRPLLSDLTWLAYRSMLLQFFVLVVSLVATSRFLRLQRYVLATALDSPLRLQSSYLSPQAGFIPF